MSFCDHCEKLNSLQNEFALAIVILTNTYFIYKILNLRYYFTHILKVTLKKDEGKHDSLYPMSIKIEI